MMKSPRLNSSLFTALPAALALLATPACAMEAEGISAEALRADISEWRDWLFATHPDPGFSMDVEAVEARFDRIATSLDGNYSRREAWLELAVLNPHFADGHIAIRLPGADYEAYLENGGSAFPLPLGIENGRLIIDETFASPSPFNRGDEILSINGSAASDLVEAALARAHGDSEELRTYLVEERFSRYLWALTGGAQSWTVDVRKSDGAVETHIVDPQRDLAREDTDLWTLDFAGDAAVLTLNTFRPDYEAEFAAFIEPAFAEIAAEGAEVLVIDISANGGGAHQLSDRLFAYLTDTRYTPLSAVTARIVPENQALIPGSQLGQVISTPFTQWVEPPQELENRFDGRFAFLIGTGTYSQAIVTATTAQDFDIAPVAGVATAGRANSTGQVQIEALDQSGLEVAAPIYVFTRASGDSSSAPIMPDLPLSGSRQEQIEALIDYLRTEAG